MPLNDIQTPYKILLGAEDVPVMRPADADVELSLYKVRDRFGRQVMTISRDD